MLVEEFLNSKEVKAVADGSYISKNLKNLVGPDRADVSKLAEAGKNYSLSLANALRDLNAEASKRGLSVDIVRKGGANSNEFQVNYIPAANVADYGRLDELGKQGKGFMAFTFSTENAKHLASKNGMPSINAPVLRYIGNQMRLATQSEQMIWAQVEKFKKPGNSFDQYLKAIEKGEKDAFEKMLKSARFTAKGVNNRVVASGGYKAASDEAWKNQQGTGTAGNRMIRRGMVNLDAFIKDITKSSEKQMVANYRKQFKKHNESWSKIQEQIGDDVMTLLMMAGQMGDENLRKAFDNQMANGVANRFKYLFTKDFKNIMFGKNGIAQEMKKLKFDIGPSGENMIKTRSASLVRNSDLSITGGLDDKSSRKRTQTYNSLTQRRMAEENAKIKKKITKAASVYTKAQRENLRGEEDGRIESRQYGIIYASIDEVEKAANQLLARRMKEKSQGKKHHTKKEYAEMLAKAKAELGLDAGFHDGGILYSDGDDHAFEKSLQGSMYRSKKFSVKLFKDLEVKEIERLNGKRKEGEKKISSLTADQRIRLLKEMIARETNLEGGSKDADRIKLAKGFRLKNALASGENGFFNVEYDQMSDMKSGKKALLQSTFDRSTLSEVNEAVIREVIKNRALEGVYGINVKKLTGPALDKFVSDYIKDNNIYLLQGTSETTARDFSGRLEAYLNTVFGLFREAGVTKFGNDDKSNILDEWVEWDESAKAFVEKKQLLAEEKARTRKSNLSKILEGIEAALDDVKDKEYQARAQALKGVFKRTSGEGITIDAKKYVGMTAANQFAAYDYGKPGFAINADYRYEGATTRAATLLSYIMGEQANEYHQSKQAYLHDSPKNRKREKRYKELQADVERATEDTFDTAKAGFSYNEKDLIISTAPIKGRRPIGFDDSGKLVYLDDNKAYDGGGNVYLDASGEFYNPTSEDYVAGGLTKEAFDKTLFGAMSAFAKARGGKIGGKTYFAPSSGGFYQRSAKGDKVLEGKAVALPHWKAEDFLMEDDGTYDGERYSIPNALSSLKGVLKADKEYLAGAYSGDVSPEDLKELRDELNLESAGLLGAYFDEVNHKGGSLYRNLARAKLSHSSFRSSSAPSLLTLSGDQTVRNILDSSAFLNRNDFRKALVHTYDVKGKDFGEMLRYNLQYMLGENEYNKKYASGGKKTTNESLLKDLLDYVTVGSAAFNDRVEKLKLGERLRGFAGEFARFPFSEGLDVKDIEFFLGSDKGNGPKIAQGAMRVGLGNDTAVNADFDGDKLIFHLDFADDAVWKRVGAGGASKLIKQKQAAVDAQAKIAAMQSGLAIAERRADDMGLSEKEFKILFDDEAQQAGALASRLFKSYTGKFSNNYQAVTEMMSKLTPDIIDPNNPKGKADALNQMIIRGLFQSFTEDAISAKKVTKRLSEKYGQRFEEDLSFLTDLDDLMSLFRSEGTYTSRESFDRAIQRAQEMGILGKKEEGLFGNRTKAQIFAYAQMMNTKDGVVDRKAMADFLGIKEDQVPVVEFNKLAGGGYEVSNIKDLAERFGGEEGKALWNPTEDMLWNAFQTFGTKIFKAQITRDDMPGVHSAADDPAKILGIAADSTKAASLSPELERLSDGYDTLGNATQGAQEKIESEADAELAKIRIAKEEASIIAALAEKYGVLGETVEGVGGSYALLAGKTKDLKKRTEDYMTSLEPYRKSLKEAKDRSNADPNKKIGTAVTTIAGQIFPTSFDPTDKFEEEVREQIRKDPEGAKKGLDFTALTAYSPEQVEKARKDLEARYLGQISDAAQQSLTKAREMGLAFDDIKTLEEYDLNEPTSSKRTKAYKKWQELHEYLNNPGGEHGSGAGWKSFKDDLWPMVQAIYGSEEGAKLWERGTQIGKASTVLTNNLVKGDPRNYGASEQGIITYLGNGQWSHGRSDTMTWGAEERKLASPITGDEVKRRFNVLTVSDKKAAQGVGPSYILQDVLYAMGLEQLRDAAIDRGILTYDRYLKELSTGDMRLTEKDFYRLIGYHEDKFDKNGKLEANAKRDQYGAIIRAGINLHNKKNGMQEFHEIGSTSVDKETGRSRISFSADRGLNDRILEHIRNRDPFIEWEPGLQAEFKKYNNISDIPGTYFQTGLGSEGKGGDEFAVLERSYEKYKKAVKRKEKAKLAVEKAKLDGRDKDEKYFKPLIKEQEEAEEEFKKIRNDFVADRKNLEAVRSEDEINAHEGALAYYRNDQQLNQFEALMAADTADRVIKAGYRQAKKGEMGVERTVKAYMAAKYNEWAAGEDVSKLREGDDSDRALALRDALEIRKMEAIEAESNLKDLEDNVSGNAYLEGVLKEALKKGEISNRLKQDSYYSRGGKKSIENLVSGSDVFGINQTSMRFFERLISGGALTKGLNLLMRGFSSMTKKAKELDAAMTNLRIVTNDSSHDAKSMVSTYADLAKELGSTTIEVTNAATEWLRQGYEAAEVTDLVTASMHLSKLGMIDSATATRDLTSAIKGFKMEASEAMDIVDKLTSIDLKAATSAGEIAEGLSQFANLATLSGVDVDQAAAYVATIADVTQSSGTSVGNSMKTILSRFGNVKAGVYNKMNVDSETEDTAESLNDVEKVLNKLGISIRSSNLEFKDFDEILDEIADRWATLDNVSKKAISNAFAGVRQQEAFTTLMENYDNYRELLETSRNSSGMAETKYKSYQESYQAAQQSLIAAFEGLVNNSNLNSLLTEITGFLKSVVEFLDQGMKYLPGLISTFSSALAMFGISPAHGIANAIAKRRYQKDQNPDINDFSDSVGIRFFKSRKAKRAAKKAAKNANGDETPSEDAATTTTTTTEVELTEEQRQQVETSSKVSSNIEAAADASAKIKDNLEKAAGSSEEEKRNKEATAAEGKEEKADKEVTAQKGEEEKQDKQETVLAAKQEKTVTQTSSTTAVSSNAGGAKKLTPSQISAVATGAQMLLNSATAAVTGYLTGAATHKYNGETVNSSEKAVNASRWATTTGGFLSGLPIIGGVLSTGFTHIAEWIAGSIDKVRDAASAQTEISNERLSNLNGIETKLSNLEGTDLDSVEAKEAASEMLQDLYSEENQETLALLNSYLGKNGGTESVYSLLSTIKDDTTSISEKTEAIRTLRLAELEAQKREVTGKYATSSYNAQQNVSDLYATANSITGWESGAAGWGGAAAGYGVGLAGAVGTAAAASVAALAVPVAGPIIAAIGGLITVGLGIAAGVSTSNAIAEQERLEQTERDKFNSESTSGKIKLIQDKIDALVDDSAQNGVDNATKISQYEAVLDALYEQSSIQNQIISEINDITLQQGLIAAYVSNGSDKTYLSDMTIAQLKNLGIDKILTLYAEGLESYGGLIGKDVWADAGHTKLSDSGYSYLMSKLREQGDDEINAVLSGESYSLAELLGLKGKFGGQKWYEDLLNSFATALGLSSIDDLEKASAGIKSLKLSEIISSTSDLRSSLEGYTSLLSSISKGAGDVSSWMETIISQFPDLIAYMGDSSTLYSKIGDKLEGLSEVYLRNQYDDIMNSTEYYDQLKGSFLSFLNDDEIADKLEKFGGETGVTSFGDILDWIQSETDANGNLSEEAQKTLDAVVQTVDEAGSKVVSAVLKDYYDMIIDFRTQILDTEINNLTEQKEALEEINSQREYENRLIEAKLKLENASKEKKRVYRAGVGWVYESDQAAIKEAQDALSEVENETTIAELEKQIAELERQKSDLSSIEDQANFEAMKGYYEEFLERQGKTNENIAEANNFFSAIQKGVEGISKTVATMVKDQVATDSKEKSDALKTAEAAWNDLKGTSTSDSSYNTKLEAYHNAARDAVAKGATEDDFESFGKTSNTKYGEELSAWDIQKGNLNDQEVDRKYLFRIPLGDDWHLTGFSLMEPLTSVSTQYDILQDTRDGYGRLVDTKGNIVVLDQDNMNYAVGDIKSLSDYAAQLEKSGNGSEFVLIGGNKDLEAVWYKNGSLYQITGDGPGKYSRGFDTVHNPSEFAWAKETAASGSLGLQGGNTLINELGTEAIITPSGTLTALPSATGIVPADITKNLWALGEVAPGILRTLELNLLPDTIGKSAMSQSTDESFNIANLVMNVTADEGFDIDEFVESVKQRAALTKNL